MKKALTLSAISFATFAMPLITSAATINNVSDVGSFIINTINNVLVPVIFAIAFIVFLWGAFQMFIIGANDPGVKEKGKNYMIWGLVGFFVMVSVWGLVNILTGTVSFSNNSGVNQPSAGVQIGG